MPQKFNVQGGRADPADAPHASSSCVRRSLLRSRGDRGHARQSTGATLIHSDFHGEYGAQIGLLPRRWLIIALLLSLVVVDALMDHAQLTILPNGACAIFLAAGIGLVAIQHHVRGSAARRHKALRACCEDVLLFAAVSLLGAVASYAIAADTHGWIDPQLAHMDMRIGFDWPAWYREVAAHRILQVAGTIAYASIFATPVLLLGVFAADRQRAEARHFIASFWLAAVISLALFHFLPTLGPLDYLWRGPIPYVPTSGLYQVDLIPLLREHGLHHVDLGALRGLVGPPSFHAASAMLYIAAAWRVRRFRLPITALNIAMLLSIPVEGTHYATDVLGGIAVALLSHALITQLARSRFVSRPIGAKILKPKQSPIAEGHHVTP